MEGVKLNWYGFYEIEFLEWPSNGLKAQSNPTKEDLPIAQGKVSVANDTLGKVER